MLKEAQDLGFAEADPTADVEGLDAARKMAILARLGFYERRSGRCQSKRNFPDYG